MTVDEQSDNKKKRVGREIEEFYSEGEREGLKEKGMIGVGGKDTIRRGAEFNHHQQKTWTSCDIKFSDRILNKQHLKFEAKFESSKKSKIGKKDKRKKKVMEV